ncbi:molybdate transport system substrate-binding protein [Desulfitispora alkaliphila]|uniref:molybdate ABC transporter substrate-binding protein n=1 Tax=Desulfitispora alkaliphila TaxID=622674 RepID=UPI003D191876
MKIVIASVLIGIITLLGGCTQDEEVLTVAAASDLQHAFRELGPLFEEETGIEVKFNFGSTGLLAQQIENGAPVDVFAAANRAYVERLAAEDLVVEDTRAIYAKGRIVLVRGQELELDWVDLSNGNWELLLHESIRNIAIANPAHAPYGKAAQEFLQSVEMWEGLEDKLVYGSSVTDALHLVTSGNAEVGIVALSIVIDREQTYYLLSEELHQPLEQEITVVEFSPAREEGRQFVELVTGPIGREILADYGFELPEL